MCLESQWLSFMVPMVAVRKVNQAITNNEKKHTRRISSPVFIPNSQHPSLPLLTSQFVGIIP